MRVLHITNWFPNDSNSIEGIWIRNQIESLPSNVENNVIHFEIKQGSPLKSFYNKKNKLNQLILYLPFEKWFVIELIYGIYLFYLFVIRKAHKNFDIINFHIAYPMLTYWHFLNKKVQKPVVITEHWSAYHFNFNVTKPLPRIKRIFSQNVPVIAVSEALLNDIKIFSGAKFKTYVLPNVIDRGTFYYDPTIKREKFFFMVSQWKWPKTPLKIMKAFLESPAERNYELVIAGYGALWSDMHNFVKENNAEDKIKLIGKLKSEEIASFLRRCSAFIHSSEYETFSVVCAESISCGCPVIASNVGGIKEFINKNNGILINQAIDLSNAIKKLHEKKYDSKLISVLASRKFASESVGNRYYECLKNVCNRYVLK